MEEERRTSGEPEPLTAAEASISVVGPEDLQAGYVDVVDSSQRLSSPFASPNGTLRTVREGVRVVSPITHTNNAGGQEDEVDDDAIPQAHAEDPQPSPARRRGTPTAAAANRRRNRHQVTYEDLVSRPRSNPRSRTPMRYESPLEHGAFTNNDTDNNGEDASSQGTAISIRPTAGLGVGVVRPPPERARLDDTVSRPRPITLKSSKQGPSHRKANRWNNDNFSNAAQDLSHSSREILALAKADARRFLPVYDPAEKKRSDQVTRFMEDEKYSGVRDKFFAGELHAHVTTPINHKSEKEKAALAAVNLMDPSPSDLYKRIDGRLQRVLTKACENSAPACKVVELFETYLVGVYDSNNDTTPDMKEWEDVLMEHPTVERNNEIETVTFLFDGASSSGGFHRLLLHAVTHFHCLKAKTSTKDCEGGKSARVLVVQGAMCGGKHCLLDHLAVLQAQRQNQRQ